MSDFIKGEDLSSTLPETDDSSVRKDVLTDEIDGMRTLFYSVVPKETVQIETSAKEGRVYLFSSGNGIINAGIDSYEISEITFPRLCIGSVETTGDDHVGAHEHPMLEQLFFGLQDNDCVVKADEAEVVFNEGVLLHIPLGSNHGVNVMKPNKLHYIWIDLFRDRKGMDWIVQEHIPEE